MAKHARTIGLFKTCTKARGPQELQELQPSTHPTEPMLTHATTKGIPITLLHGMSTKEQTKALHYCAHTSASKEVDFFYMELTCERSSGGTWFVLQLTYLAGG